MYLATYVNSIIYFMHCMTCTQQGMYMATRLENIIFTEENEGYLIDYDFARNEGEHYLLNYNDELDIRHKEASPS